jgi:hypothetical protein
VRFSGENGSYCRDAVSLCHRDIAQRHLQTHSPRLVTRRKSRTLREPVHVRLTVFLACHGAAGLGSFILRYLLPAKTHGRAFSRPVGRFGEIWIIVFAKWLDQLQRSENDKRYGPSVAQAKCGLLPQAASGGGCNPDNSRSLPAQIDSFGSPSRTSSLSFGLSPFAHNFALDRTR